MESTTSTLAASDASDQRPETQLEPIHTGTEVMSHHHHHHHHEDTAEERASKIALAVQEGHDADIPSNIGYVLSESGEKRRRDSIARRISHASATRPTQEDLEKGGTPPQNAVDESESTDSEADPNVVWWDGPDDPENPLNWPSWRKVVNCGMISALSFITPLGSSMFAPGVPEVMQEFDSRSNTLAAFIVSVYVLGFAAGPMLFAPLSELYGRLWVYHGCNLGFTIFLMACALAPDMNSLIVFRFFSGVFGSTPLTNGGGSIADMIPQNQRAAWMAVFSLGPLMGPVIGPVAGGFVSDGPGWRWCFWILTIIAGSISCVMFLFGRETYAPIILERKAKRLRQETGNEALRSKLDVGLSPKDYFKTGIVRPFVLLVKSPICITLSLYMGVVYGYLYLMFTSITSIFLSTYHWSASTVGLSFLGIGIGSLVGLGYYSITSDRYVKKKIAQQNERLAAEGKDPVYTVNPEVRLPPLLVGAPAIPLGLFLYGWTAEYGVHWIVPIIGTLFVGIGNIIVFMALLMYLVDAYQVYAASALAANTVVRSVAGAVLPLAGLPMFDKLGYGWGNSLLGFIAVAMLPIPWFLLKYGERMRHKFDLKDLM